MAQHDELGFNIHLIFKINTQNQNSTTLWEGCCPQPNLAQLPLNETFDAVVIQKETQEPVTTCSRGAQRITGWFGREEDLETAPTLPRAGMPFFRPGHCRAPASWLSYTEKMTLRTWKPSPLWHSLQAWPSLVHSASGHPRDVGW